MGVFTDGLFTKGHIVACPEPECMDRGGEHMHPVRVVVNSGGVITTISSEGTTVSKGVAEGRGVKITIHFDGECGHSTKIDFHFNEGSTFAESTATGECCDGEDLHMGETIWRD